MPLPEINQIGEWSPTQLAKFIQQTLFTQPLPVPKSLELDSLDVAQQLQVGGNTVLGGLLSAAGGVQLQGGMVRRDSPQTIGASEENVTFTEKIYQSEFVTAHSIPGGLRFTQPGIYLLGASVTWTADGTGRRQIAITSQTGAVTLARDNRNPVGSVVTVQNCTALVPLSGSILNQTIRLRVAHSLGVGLDISANRFSPVLWAIFVAPLGTIAL